MLSSYQEVQDDLIMGDIPMLPADFDGFAVLGMRAVDLMRPTALADRVQDAAEYFFGRVSDLTEDELDDLIGNG